MTRARKQIIVINTGEQGLPGDPGLQVELSTDAGNIVWRYVGDTSWNILCPIPADGDDGIGVPVGGATKQVLRKLSAADNDTEWAHSLETFGVACSDLTTALTTGEKAKFDIPFDFVATRIFASVATAPTGSSLNIDIEDEGTSILNAVLSVAASANNAETSVFAASASSYTFAKGDQITIDIDQIGSIVAGAGLIVFIEGYRA